MLRVHPLHGTGEVCLACLHPIMGIGRRITWATLTTHTHLGCKAAALRLLGGWAAGAEMVPRMVPASVQNQAGPVQRCAEGQEKTPRQVRDLPRGEGALPDL